MIDLTNIKSLDQRGDHQQALDLLYEEVLPRRQRASDLDLQEIETMLAEINPADFSSTLLCGFLVITAPGKNRFPSRAKLLERTKTHLITTRPENAVQELLRGLE